MTMVIETEATCAARVVAVDLRASARDLAVQCGADLALAPEGTCGLQ